MDNLDLLAENPLTLVEAANRLPNRHGKKVHYSTIYRWATKGTRGRVLETAMVGGVRYTSVEAITRFLSSPAGNHVDSTDKTAKQPVTSDLLAVERALQEAGL